MSVLEGDTTALTSLGAELRRQLETKRDLVADTRRFHLTDAGAAIDMRDGVETFSVLRHAHQQIGDTLGIPWKLYERLQGTQPDLLQHLANGLLDREPSKRLIRTMDGNVRAFLSDRYRPRDNWDLMQGAILPELNQYRGRLTFKQATLTETRMYLKVVLPDIEKPVTPKVGDVVRGGIIIQNSETGQGALSIFPYTDRLICLNGMVHTDKGQRSVHLGGRITEESWDLYTENTLQLDDAAFFAKCRDTVRGILDGVVFDAIVAQMRDLADIRITGDPVAHVEELAKRHTLTESESGSMLAALVEGADLSAWGYVNALTQTARDLDDADRQTELETLAGRLTADRAQWEKRAAVAA